MPKPKVLVLRAAGTNCDRETAFAFEKAGAKADLAHINQLIRKERDLSDYQILSIPGGFTYGDDISAGKILANELKYKLLDEIKRFIQAGKLIIGICNGFQILVKSGLLPGSDDLKQEASLIINDSGKFEDRWVYLKAQSSKLPATKIGGSAKNFGGKAQKCIWTRNLPGIIYLPVAHGEGKFITKDKKVLERLRRNGQIVFQYCNEEGRLSGYPDNPNGSQDNIAGICDKTGRILGLMPHPERYIDVLQHPRWRRKNSREGEGLQIFKNGVDYAKETI